MKWLPLLALLASAALAGCDRAPTSPPTPKATPDSSAAQAKP